MRVFQGIYKCRLCKEEYISTEYASTKEQIPLRELHRCKDKNEYFSGCAFLIGIKESEEIIEE